MAGIELQRLLRPAIAHPAESPAASYDRLSAWAGDLTALHELTGRLARTTELEQALYEIVRAGAQLIGARRGFAVLHPADGRSPDTRVGYGIGAAELGAMETVPRASTSYGRILDAPAATRPADVCRPDLAAEPDLHPRHRDVAMRLGYAAGYAVPLAATAAGTGTATGATRAPGRAGPAGGGGPAGRAPAGPRPPGPGQPDQGGMAQPGQTGTGQRRRPPPALLGAVEWLYDGPARPTERQRRITGLYARHAGDHLARILDLARARTTADAVRAALLPARLPRVPGARVAVRHRTGPLGGGDFYDVLPLPDGALGLAVGSAGGGGPAAVAAMGQLRAGLRAYAVMEGEDPVAVLSDLELLMRLTEPGRRATALFAYAPPGRRSMVVAGAGHCPPLVTGPWRTEYAETSLSAPLNMLTCWEAPSVTIDPAPGETILLYTDGLLHRTGRPTDQAMNRLHHAAATAPAPVRDDPEALTDHVLARLLPAGPDDGAGHPEDVVLLAVQLTG
ncbi:PP2C family protein-serine/threonine phosphatase [Streptomyces sp. WMMC500]|uniref:PP2C family protein-serine/threonine phosphatase n=1 Tax=Streptomyces sp. WMMC500 TaxID=3015154 RepID=UPI00248C1FC1|nr:PP2C family protein-serine/threonine phosphatase [Streptomyces sp. WMMC500]WBB58027.1 PP2C family protein-serine/threonine phosphatase [Streptomyces sp. WMMC500]